MADFSSLKRNRNSFDKLTKAVESINTPTEGSGKDERFWQPEVDKAGNGMAVIRFLPAPAVDGDDALPWVRLFDHGFQGPGGWYIENSLTTLNQKDPVSEYNSVLWNSGIEANKEIARKQKRRLYYIANILVVSDPKNPDNEGQIRLYKFGKKIFDKITEAMNPQFEDEKAINPFDFWEGANFKLKIRQVEGYRNYDKSEFEKSSAVFDGDDAKLEALWKKQYSLKEFLDPKHFKSYDELKARLDKVLGLDGAAPVSKTKAVDDNFVPKTSPDLESDEELDYFKSLAED
jgi:gp32 DNA binding protein like